MCSRPLIPQYLPVRRGASGVPQGWGAALFSSLARAQKAFPAEAGVAAEHKWLAFSDARMCAD